MQLLKSHEIHHDSSILGKFPSSVISVDQAALMLVCSQLVTRHTHITDYHLICGNPLTSNCHYREVTFDLRLIFNAKESTLILVQLPKYPQSLHGICGLRGIEIVDSCLLGTGRYGTVPKLRQIPKQTAKPREKMQLQV